MKATVRKRRDTGKWIMDTMVEGERYKKTLGHGSKSWAQAQGDLKLAEMMAERKRVAPEATVAGLLSLWEQYGNSGQSRKGKLAETTIRQARNAFLDVCRLGAGLDEGGALAALTPAAVRAWHLAELEKDSGRVMVSGQRRLASINAKWIQAKSVFGRRAVTYYRDMGLDVTGWARDLREVLLPKGHVPAYDLPPDELVEKIETEGRKLKSTNPELWIVYALGINCGLRAAEIAGLRKSWVVKSRGVLLIELIEREGWRPKGAERSVPIHAEMWEDICKLSEGLETVLPGTDNQRYEIVTKDFSNWMKSLGWKRRKKAHELRKLFGSRIYTDLDPAAAKEYLGHTSMDTTTRFYAKLDRAHKLLPMR